MLPTSLNVLCIQKCAPLRPTRQRLDRILKYRKITKEHFVTVLALNSSINGEHSVSRRLVAAIVEQIAAANPAATVVTRDLVADGVPHIQARPDATNPYLAEFLAADTIIIGTPMYNFGVPSQLKAWLDYLAVPGATFNYVNGMPVGSCGEKTVIIASSRAGGFSEGSPYAFMDHQETHLKAFLAFLSVTKLQVVRAEGYGGDPEKAEQALQATCAALPAFA
jgi:FMN-dependent NADH-azoreductase